MFCHASRGTRGQRRCSSDADCPLGGGCDASVESLAPRGDKGAYCIDLACGPGGDP